MTRSLRIAAPLAVLVSVAGAQADDLSDLLLRVPGSMNTVAVVNVREINKTPRAVREKWREQRETEYLAGAIAIPSWVNMVVVGSEVHPRDLSHRRSIELIPIENAASSATIAKRENGVVQTVDDLTLVLSPTRGYFGFPAPGIIGISSSMPRQDFARWTRWARRPEAPAISKYLQDAIAAHKDAHIVVAIDLKDCLDPTTIRAALQMSGVMSGERQTDSFVNIFSRIQGVIFTGQIEESTTKGTLRFEFGLPMAEFLEPVQRLWPKALAAAGLEIDELKNAEGKADGRAVVFTANLSDTSLRRLLSVINSPGGDSLDSEVSPKLPSSKDAAMLSASIRYFRAVNSALDDLAGQGAAKGKDYARSAVLFNNFAGRIEKLSIVNVDPLLVQYGTSVAVKLRSMAASLNGVQMQLAAFDNYKSTTWVSGGNGFIMGRGLMGVGGGNVQMSTNVQELSTRQAELVAKLEPERARLWSILQSDRSSIRKEMLDKYGVDFEQFRR